MIKHKDSHLDHALTEAQVNFITERFKDRDGFFIETFELPETLGTVPCGLFGPLVGDTPIVDRNVDTGEGEAYYRKRGTRAYESRLVERAPRMTRKVTVIAGPYLESVGGTDSVRLIEHPCILYTAFGGPVSAREPGDIKAEIEKVRHGSLEDLAKADKLASLEQNLIDSMAFWREHALSGLA